jgi:serine/threonine protein kinase
MAEGKSLGPYRLLRELGRGTSGVVHLAERSDLGRGEFGSAPVALKRLTQTAGPEDRERLRREAAVMANLSHPNVVKIIDVIDDGDSVALAMAYAPGGSLRDRLRAEKSVSTAELVNVVAPIADALANAHQHGVIHRDVKPANILFAADGTPLLTDFGIARSIGSTALTRTDTALGTAGYLAPEVADGSDHSVASDVYGLGVVAYEALTGSLPFEGKSPLAVLRAADKGEFVPLDRSVHGAVADVVEKAMARRPEDRFGDSSSFAAALRSGLGQAAGPRPASGFDTAPTAGAAGSTKPDGSPDGSIVGSWPPSPENDPVRRTTRLRRARSQVLNATTSAQASAPTNRKKMIAGAAAASVLLAGGGWFAATQRDSGPKSVIAFRPPCTPGPDVACLNELQRTPSGIRVGFIGSDEDVDFPIERSDDVAIAGNWFCGPIESLALYRPSDGTVRYYRSWPKPGEGPVDAVADRTGMINARVLSASDHNNDGCADLALETSTERVWFLPALQEQRLEPIDPESA